MMSEISAQIFSKKIVGEISAWRKIEAILVLD